MKSFQVILLCSLLGLVGCAMDKGSANVQEWTRVAIPCQATSIAVGEDDLVILCKNGTVLKRNYGF